MIIRFASSTLMPSNHGWRLTCYDANSEPVASFWSAEKQDVLNQAARVVAAS